jgi:hypothetical protein
VSKFNVGDRVAVYGPFGDYFAAGRMVGVINGEHKDGLEVLGDEGDRRVAIHPKQCRRLVKKEREEFWLFIHKGDCPFTNVVMHSFSLRPAPCPCKAEVVHVREVRK